MSNTSNNTEPEKVERFEIRQSKLNKYSKILVAVTEKGKEYVMGGDHWHPTYILEAERSTDITG